jgi:hypothetical protein
MRNLIFNTIALTLLFICAIMWWREASAYGRQVYLEDERDLGNGMKLCIYSEGVTITVASHRLCPLSIEI